MHYVSLWDLHSRHSVTFLSVEIDALSNHCLLSYGPGLLDWLFNILLDVDKPGTKLKFKSIVLYSKT